MDISTAIATLTNILGTPKVENGGVDASGKLSANEFNAVATILNALRTLGAANTNVSAQANGSSANDVVLFRAANSSQWTIKNLSEISQAIDVNPTANSSNAVSSGGVYIRISELLQSISELADNVAYIGEEEEGGAYTAGGGSVDLTDYALKTWVIQNFLAKVYIDSTPTENSNNPVTSHGIKQYVDQHAGSGGGDTNVIETVKVNGTALVPDANKAVNVVTPKITTFSVRSSTANDTTTYNWGTTKYSDINTAISNSDVVQISLDGVVYKYSFEIFGVIGFYSLAVVSGVGVSILALTEGNNDTIEIVKKETEITNADWNVAEPTSPAFIKNKPSVPKVTVFTSTSTGSGSNVVFDFGTTKFSDITAAIANSDFVYIENNGVRYTYAVNFLGVLQFYNIIAVENMGIMTLMLQRDGVDGIKGTVGIVEIQPSDWNETDTESNAYIKHKPTIPKITTFNVTGTTENGVTTYNWGNTKYSDIEAAISNSDIVQIVSDGGLVTLTYGTTITDVDTVHVFYGILRFIQTGIVYFMISEGANDSIVVTTETQVLQQPDWNEADNTSLAFIKNKPTYALGESMGGNAVRASGIPFGQVDSTSTSTAFTATVDGITELRDGVCVFLMNGVVTSAEGFTININGLGAKPVYSTMAAASRSTTLFNVNYTLFFVYNSHRVSGGCWDAYYGYYTNTNTIGYQLRTNSSTLPLTQKTYRYRLLFTSADGTKFVPANGAPWSGTAPTGTTSTNATSKREVNQEPIDPHGGIYYYGSTTAITSSSTTPAATVLWQQYTLTLGYSFNRTGAALVLTYPAPVYVKCAPQADGSAIIDADNPYVQALPTTADGKIYIYLGRAYSATAIELMLNHPVYHYYNGAIRLWTGPV